MRTIDDLQPSLAESHLHQRHHQADGTSQDGRPDEAPCHIGQERHHEERQRSQQATDGTGQAGPHAIQVRNKQANAATQESAEQNPAKDEADLRHEVRQRKQNQESLAETTGH
jgi:hypothetical protein